MSQLTLDGQVPAVTGGGAMSVTAFSDWADTLLDVAGADLQYWARHGEDVGATVLRDSGGGGHDGVITLGDFGPGRVAPLVGEGFATDWGTLPGGIDGGFASVDDGGWFDPSGGVTIGTWINVRSGQIGQQRIMAKRHSFTFFVSITGLLLVTSISKQPVTGDDFAQTSSVQLTPGRHFLLVTAGSDASVGAGGVVKAYYDASSISGSGGPLSYPNKTEPSEPIVFGDLTGSGDESLFGIQAETFIIGRAITAAEVVELYVAGAQLEMSLAGTIPRTTGSFVVETDPMLTLDGTIPRTTGAFQVLLDAEIELDGVIPRTTGHFELVKTEVMVLDGTIPRTVGSFAIQAGELQLAGLIPRVVGAFELSKGAAIVARWSLYDAVANETFVFPINPNAMSPIVRRRELKHARGRHGIASQQQPKRDEAFEFSGVIRSQAFYDALVTWTEKPNALIVTDHTGRQFRVYLTDFQPVDRSPIPRAPKRWRYTVKAKLLEDLS